MYNKEAGSTRAIISALGSGLGGLMVLGGVGIGFGVGMGRYWSVYVARSVLVSVSGLFGGWGWGWGWVVGVGVGVGDD